MSYPTPLTVEVLEARIAPASVLVLDNSNHLLRMDSSNPSAISTITVVGLASGEKMTAIDVRPETLELYALTDGGHFYLIDPDSGLAHQLSGSSGVITGAVGFDFDPASDTVRLTTTSGLNKRLDPSSGAIIASDAPLQYAPGDPHFYANPKIVGIAYSNNFAQATSAALYGIDSGLDILVAIDPSTGILTTIGNLGIQPADQVGFDIAPNGTAYLSANIVLGGLGGLVAQIYTVNLTSGAASLQGGIGSLGGLLVSSVDVAVVPAEWTGKGANPNWNLANNWQVSQVPGAGESLSFSPGASGGTSNNDLPSGMEFGEIVFTTGGNTLTGNPVTLDHGIRGLSPSGTNTVGLGIALSGDQGLASAGNSVLAINGAIAGQSHSLTLSGSGRIELAGALSQLTALVKTGTGTSILSADNAYAGTTTLGAGVLQIDGIQTGSAVSVEGGTLSGHGTVGAINVLGGTIDPGTLTGSGILHGGNLNLGAGSKLSVDMSGLSAGSGYDQLEVAGSVTLQGALETSILLGLQAGNHFVIISNDGADPVNGTFLNLPQGATFSAGGHTLAISYTGGDGNDVELTVQADPGGGGGGTGTGSQSLHLVNARTAQFIDVDGDLVTLKLSKGSWSTSDFVLVGAGSVGGAQLQVLNFSDDGLKFQGASLSVSAKPSALGGNGSVNIGYLNASGVDLGRITIAGDLSQIDAGNPQMPAHSIAKLTVQSMGLLGADTQPAGGSLSSDFVGTVGTITVKANVKNATIHVVGDSTAAQGQIGLLKIGGSLSGGSADESGSVFATGSIGKVQIGKNLEGGSGLSAGEIESGGRIHSVSIGRSIIGAEGINSGLLESTLGLGKLTLGRDLLGGSGANSGSIHSLADITSVKVGGGLFGDAGIHSGSIWADDGITSTANTIRSVSLGNNLMGGSGAKSGAIFAADKLQKVLIGGTISGAEGIDSGSLIAGGNLSGVIIRGDLKGGSADYSGSIRTYANGRITSIWIGGNLIGGSANLTGILSDLTLGMVTVRGDVRGDEINPLRIQAEGVSGGVDARQALAIKQLRFGGSVEHTNVLAGYDITGAPSNPDVQIGKVTVASDWIASNLVAGIIGDAQGNFGTSSDVVIGSGGNPIVAKIAMVVIGGQVLGTVAPTDHFGFVAQELGSLKIKNTKITFDHGIEDVVVAPTGDVNAKEVITLQTPP